MFFFKYKYAEAILSNSSRKLLRSEITKMLIVIAVLINKFIVLFVIIFGRLSFPVSCAKTAEPTEMQFSDTDSGGPKEPCFR